MVVLRHLLGCCRITWVPVDAPGEVGERSAHLWEIASMP